MSNTRLRARRFAGPDRDPLRLNQGCSQAFRVEPDVTAFIQVRQTLAGRAAAARAAELGRDVHIPAEDSSELATPVAPTPDAPPLRIQITYRDAKGQVSRRIIVTQKILEADADFRVFAFCHQSLRVKSFLATRMLELVDLSTGEVCEDACGWFRSHPLLAPEPAADASPEIRALRDRRHDLAILVFLAAADGEVCEDEVDALLLHICDGCDEALDTETLRRNLLGYAPDERAFWSALEQLGPGKAGGDALRRSLRRVAEADGRLTLEEMAFVELVQSRLSSRHP